MDNPTPPQREPTPEQLANVARVCAIGPSAHYDVLGVEVHAGPREVRQAFIETIKLVHPNHNPAPCATEAAKLVQEAWEVLRDPARRSAYDLQRGRASNDPAYNFSAPSEEAQFEYLARHFEERRQAQMDAVLRAWQEAQELRQMRNQMIALLYAYMYDDVGANIFEMN